MSRVLTNEQNYYDIADTIRQMKDVNTTYKPREMASALKDIYSNEVEGTLPLSFQANGMPLIDYRIDGASGGVGNRTENLFNKDTVTDNSYIKGEGGLLSYSGVAFVSDYIPIENATTYTLSWFCESLASTNSRNAAVFDAEKNYIKKINNNYNDKSSIEILLDTPDAAYIRFTLDNNMSNIMFKKGSIVLPYEPYGYKVPVVVSGKNLLPPINEWESGYLNTSGTISSANVDRKEITSPFIHVNQNETYAFSFYPNEGDAWRCVGYYKANKEFISRKFASTTSDPIFFTTPANVEFIRLSYRTYGDGTYAQLEQNSEVTTYETYHEPTTTNIYLDEPISENESISLSDTEVDIPTIEGTNVLTIDTTVQPSNVYVQAPKDTDEIIYLTTILEEGI